MNLADLSDEEVVKLVVGGNVDAYAVIVQRYQSKLSAYGHRFLSQREDIEDQVQEIFIKAYRNLASFDPARRFSPWIYRVAHNTFVNALRSRQRHPVILFDTDAFLPHTSSSHPESDLDQVETRRLLERGIKQLDTKYREPMILFYFEDLSYQDISEIMRIPVSTVGVRISRGRSQLRRQLDPKLNPSSI